MAYRHSLSDQLFDVRRVAFCELVAWGFSNAHANVLCGCAYDTSNASRVASSKRNAPRIDGLKAKPPEMREWEYAFALLVLNRWTAVDACKRLGQGEGCSSVALRKRASRAMKRPAVRFAIVRMASCFRLTKQMEVYVERHHRDAWDYWAAKNRARLLLYGPIDAARYLYRPPKRKRVAVNSLEASTVSRVRPKLRNAAGKHICGAKTRSGNRGPCQCKPVPGKDRCRLHGGLSTGPKTTDGKARSSQNARRHSQSV